MEGKDNNKQAIPTKRFYSCKVSSEEVENDVCRHHQNVVDQAKALERKHNASMDSDNRHLSKSKAKSKARLSFNGAKITNNKYVTHKIRPEQFRHSFGSNNSPTGYVKLEHIAKCTSNEKLRDILVTKHIFRERINAVYEMCRNSGNPIDRARPLKCLTNDTCSNEINNNKGQETCIKYENNEPCLEINPTKLSSCDLDKVDLKLEPEFDDDDDDTDIDNVSTFSLDLTINNQQSYHNLLDVIKDDKTFDNQQDTTPTTCNKSNKKFFKSDRKQNTPKMVTITNKIRADLCDNGQFSLNFNEDKFSRQRRLKMEQQMMQESKNKFFQEQIIVDEIIKSLNDTAFDDISSHKQNEGNTNDQQDDDDDFSNNNLTTEEKDPYHKYRQRIPFKTNCEELRQRQELMLDFLIENNICNEKNFTIFIGEPDKYRAEAQLIVEKLMKQFDDESDNENNQTLYKENCKLAADKMYSTGNAFTSGAKMTCQTPVNKPLSDNSKSCERKMFSIFDTNNSEKPKLVNKCKPLELLLNRPKRNLLEKNNSSTNTGATRRLFGLGYNQYQIDAGQKNYGSIECPQCGLLYTVHEPEEERLHSEYHSSVKLLRFKGWLEERIISRHLDWGHDGRILSLCETSNVRQLQRLTDILTQVIDKELGYTVTSSTMGEFQLPRIFKAFLAVRKMQFVGVCLVEPLRKAYKYVNIKGVDCCTEEQFDALCGISRIWVSPLHRRLGIATKLIQTARSHTIMGRSIPFEKMAFSIPTEVGKLFALKVTKINNFLIYQPKVNYNI